MFDVTKRISYENAQLWYWDVTNGRDDDIPTALCGNKVDLPNREVEPGQINFHREKNNMAYFDISSQDNLNYEQPFLFLARNLSGVNDLRFV